MVHFQQFYLGCLSHASYVIASEGIGAVVDPQRDVGIYMEEAERAGFRIEHIIETHLHADFVSGHRELAERTGARIYLGGGSGAKFPHVAVKDGDEISFGRCRLGFLQTPGHTPESICILVTDLDRRPEPYAVLTGDTLFIGDVGRPDLSPVYTPQELAGMLHDSLHGKLLKLGDDVEVWPAHGAGSLCGRQLSSERSSTLGMQRRTNYALLAGSRDEFIRLLTAEMPERPGYFAAEVEINRAGAAALDDLPPPAPLSPAEVLERQKHGAVALDTRPAPLYCPAHIPGALQIGLGGQFASWAGALLGLDSEIVIVAEDDERVQETRVRLARVGIEKVTGYLRGGMTAWLEAKLPVAQTGQISAVELEAARSWGDRMQILDVRRQAEWDEGHVPGALHRPLNVLGRDVNGLDRSGPVAVYCKSGYRSTIAASVLERAGFQSLVNVNGGFDAWKSSGLAVAAI
jgi:glyoxylase-like metal-dependent hydrolase (beta-lactamase superfamily II)/rhodanese-related sulfurtransferase